MRAISSSGRSWEKGRFELKGFRGSGFGEVFVALDKTSSDLVAIKKVKVTMSDADIEGEWRLLRECQSRYIVRYFSVVRRESELWVG